MADNKLVYSKDGKQFFEMDDTPENRADADSKGYQQYIDVVHPDKGEYTIPATVDNLKDVQEKGYSIKGVEVPQVAPPEKGTTTEALALGTVGGYTMGAGEVAVGKLAGKEQVEALKQEHPYAYGAGQVAGTIASPISLGGAALKYGATKLPQLAALASKLEGMGMLAKGAMGSLKGSIVGATDVGAQHVITTGSTEGLGEAIKTGAEFGAGAGALGDVLRPVAEAAAEKAAVRATYRELGLTPQKLTKISRRFGNQIKDMIADTARTEKLLPGMKPQEALVRAEKLQKKAGESMGDAMDQVFSGLSGKEKELSQTFAPHTIAQSMEEKLLSGFPEKITDSTIQRQHDKITKEILPQMVEMGKEGGIEGIKKMRNYLTSTLKKVKTDNLPESKQAYSDAISAFNKTVEEIMPEEIATQFKEARTAYGALSDIISGLEKKTGESLTDAASVGGKLVRGKPLEAVTAAAAKPAVALSRKMTAQYAPEFTAGLGEALQKTGERSIPFLKTEQDSKKNKNSSNNKK